MGWRAVGGLILLVALLVLVLTIVGLPSRRKRVQFGLRTLLICVALVAVLLSAVTSWRYFGTARTEWLAPASAVALRLRLRRNAMALTSLRTLGPGGLRPAGRGRPRGAKRPG